MSVGINGKTTGGCTGKGFLPGQSGNPYGRPKIRAQLSWEIKKYLDGISPANKDKTRLQVLLERLEKEDPITLLRYGFGRPDKRIIVTKTRPVYIGQTADQPSSIPHAPPSQPPAQDTPPLIDARTGVRYWPGEQVDQWGNRSFTPPAGYRGGGISR